MTVSPPPAPQSVSRETRAALDVVAAQVRKWQSRINLVASSTVKDLETRHLADSLQLADIAPKATRWLDLGSGGGFPGLVVAATMIGRPEAEVWLVESNAKKCAFLRETARTAGLPVRVFCGRIEQAPEAISGRFDVVSARALAPLVRLLDHAAPFLARGGIGLFPKGADVDDELEEAARSWQIRCDLIQSRTEPRAAIVKVMSATPL